MASAGFSFEHDAYGTGGVTLFIGGAAQSHVDFDRPAHLFFEYVRRIGHVLDGCADPGAPISALHLGGGALTLPRYVAATRPGSRQVVVESDAALVAAVDERMPPPDGVTVVVADAADALRAPTGALAQRFDIIVIDVYVGLDAPEFVDGRAFWTDCVARLEPGGLIVANVSDAAGLARLRAQALAASRAAPGCELVVAGDPVVLSGAEEGNAVLVVSPAGTVPPAVVRRLVEGGPFPARVLTRNDVDHILWPSC